MMKNTDSHPTLEVNPLVGTINRYLINGVEVSQEVWMQEYDRQHPPPTRRWYAQLRLGSYTRTGFIPTGQTNFEAAEEYIEQYSSLFYFDAKVASWIQL